MKDELDQLLDEALASYSLEEPRAGLSARVMARIRTERAPSGGGWWLLAVAAAAIVCIAIALSVRTQSVPVRPTTVAVVTHPEIHPPVVAARRKPAKRLPRRDKFPSPAPLTEEERSLISFAQLAPEVARQLAEPAKPLEVQPITIQPIEIDGLPTGENQ
jgi:hypothetical protein